VVKKRRKKVTYKKVRVKVTVQNHRSVEKVYTNLGDMILKRMARFGI
jgi:putative lipoic acid-binding regulatory protein